MGGCGECPFPFLRSPKKLARSPVEWSGAKQGAKPVCGERKSFERRPKAGATRVSEITNRPITPWQSTQQSAALSREEETGSPPPTLFHFMHISSPLPPTKPHLFSFFFHDTCSFTLRHILLFYAQCFGSHTWTQHVKPALRPTVSTRTWLGLNETSKLVIFMSQAHNSFPSKLNEPQLTIFLKEEASSALLITDKVTCAYVYKFLSYIFGKY